MLVFPEWQAANLWNRGSAVARLKPVRMVGWSYSLGEATLTSRYLAAQRHLLQLGVVTADGTLAIDGNTYSHEFFWKMVDGKTCYLAPQENDYAFSMPSENVYRFEVRRGDTIPGTDTTNNRRRSELVSINASFNSGETVWTSFSFVVPVGAESSFNTIFPSFKDTDRCSIWQWHNPSDVVGGPWLLIELNQGNLEVVTRSSAASGAVVRYTATRPTDGVVHNVVMRATLGASGQLSVWLDGTQIVNTGTIPIGYYGGSSVIGYAQFGIYQNNLDPTAVVYHANCEWGTTDLTARIATPLSVTVPDNGWV